LNSRPKGAYFQFEEFDQPQLGFRRAFKFINPSAGKIMERIFTLLTAVLFACDSVCFSALALRAKNSLIFVTLFSKVQPSRIIGFNEFFKGFNVHRHHCNGCYLVQKPL